MASDEKEYMRRMADALRSGAKMLADHCPVCNSPLFEIKGQIWCLRCNKRVIKVRGEEDVEEALTAITLSEAIKVLTTKVEEVILLLKRSGDVEETRKLTEAMSRILEALEKALKLKQAFTGKQVEE